jgi:hypothetical protein
MRQLAFSGASADGAPLEALEFKVLELQKKLLRHEDAAKAELVKPLKSASDEAWQAWHDVWCLENADLLNSLPNEAKPDSSKHGKLSWTKVSPNHPGAKIEVFCKGMYRLKSHAAGDELCAPTLVFYGNPKREWENAKIRVGW